MKEIKISKIGLTQFAIMNGAVLKSYNKESGVFVLDSEKSSQEWRLCYAASPYSAFNAGLMELQNIKKGA